jgi:hypothetical protein
MAGPHFIELRLKDAPPKEFAAIHVKRSAFKAGEKYVSHLALPAYEYAKRVLDTSVNPTSLWIALRFLRTLIKASISPTQILEAALLVDLYVQLVHDSRNKSGSRNNFVQDTISIVSE